MKDLAVFIVTKDRPLLLWGLLESIEQSIPCLVGRPVFVLYKNSNLEYSRAFDTVCERFPWISPIPEYDFREDFLGTLESISDLKKYCLAFTDDTFLYSRLSYELLEDGLKLFENPNFWTLSLRIGLNTIVQDPENPDNEMKIPAEFEDGVNAVWDWREDYLKHRQDKNTNYPMSLDGHIYRSEDLLAISEQIQFNNLREWEGELIGRIRKKNINIPNLMGCFAQSYCVNLPYSMTQPPFFEKQGPYGVSTKGMLELFEEGYRLDLEKMFETQKIIGSHQYIPQEYKREEQW